MLLDGRVWHNSFSESLSEPSIPCCPALALGVDAYSSLALFLQPMSSCDMYFVVDQGHFHLFGATL